MKKNWAFILIGAGLLTAGTAFAGEGPKEEKASRWSMTFGAEERFRAEYKKDFDLNESRKDNGSQFNNRFLLNAKATFLNEDLKLPKLDIFVEGLDAQTGAHQIKANAAQTDDFDLHQAYFYWHNILASDFSLKGGRQEVKYGKARLIDAATWSNRMPVFDAGILRYRHDGFYADLLYIQPMKFDDDKMNQSRSEEFVSGIYGGYQKDKKTPLYEAYFLDLTDIKGANDIHRHTVGARVQANIMGGTVLDLEMPFQFGKTGTTTAGTRDIRAYAFHADVSKNFNKTFWKPKLTVSYDEASGDRDPNDSVNNTFVPLYQSTHGPYGLMDFFRWQNVRNPEVSAVFSLTEKLRMTPQADFFWLQNKNDAWYNTSGGVVRSKTSGDRNDYVGSELSLRANYDFTKNIKWEPGYAHFFSGGYAKDTGADDDIDWVYSQLTLKY